MLNGILIYNLNYYIVDAIVEMYDVFLHASLSF